LSSGRYLYDPAAHSLSNRTSDSSGKAAFVLNYERERDFDAGVSYMLVLLGSVSMWNGTGSQLASCPKQESLYFGNNSFGEVIANLKYTSNFTGMDISIHDLSQLLWAGYGNTPHMSYNERGGLTVPSWYADYYLTENIYVVNRDGVYRYHNPNPPDDLTSRDHRIELIKKGDMRDALRSSVRELPDAPLYIVLSLDADDMDKWYALLEAGVVAGNILMQGSAIGVGRWFTTGLGDYERKSMRDFTGMNMDDIPFVIVSTGYIIK